MTCTSSTRWSISTGLAAFREAWEKALRKYKVFLFHDIEVIGTDEQFTLTYSMTIAFGFGPSFTTDMATSCRATRRQGRLLRDYFDPLGSLVQPLGPVHWFYREALRCCWSPE